MRISVVSGPNLAREIAQRQYGATVVACADEGAAQRLQKACHTRYFRPYTNTDVTGCEFGGAVKNVIALAVGMAVAMGLGDNTKAMLMTRGLAEIARLGTALGAQPQTFAGLAGLGDLVATCGSPLSRNRTFARAGPLARRGDADHRGHDRGHARGPAGDRGGRAARVPLGEAGMVRVREVTSWT
jgi:glycerol-3-phosphate dehydrogenase (NAD(P)+)